MVNNNHDNNLTCGYVESLIDVLYGESNAHDKQKFDAHLESCVDCRRELADFGTARSAMLEWREIEFSPLATPEIVVPFALKTLLSNVAKTKNAGIRRKFLDIFDVRKFWVQGSLAFAALVICATLFMFGALLSENSRDVSNAGGENSPENAAIATNAKPQIDSTPTPDAAKTETVKQESKQSDFVQKQQPTVKTSSAKNNFPAVRLKTNAAISKGDSNINNFQPKPRFVQPKKFESMPNVKRAQPNLSVLPEEADEDATPRLTDLLDEISPAS